MTQNLQVIFRWVYTPQDFFEEKETVLLPDCEPIIENGHVAVMMNLDESSNLPEIQKEIEGHLKSFFEGSSLFIRKKFHLQHNRNETIYPDGHKNFSILLEGSFTPTGKLRGIMDRDGRIIADTKQEILAQQRELASLAVKYRQDPVADRLLTSHQKALSNPGTELVHLYEIRDALCKKFSGKISACDLLGLSGDRWDRLGKLANSLSIRQGRHTGQHVGQLRDATDSELGEARDIAVKMVVAYLMYLERTSTQAAQAQTP